jgi:hypothetical protein
MIIKVGDGYLDFDGDVEMERQVMSIDNFENVGDFSYSFTVQPTSNNKRLLGIESIDENNKTIFKTPGTAQILTDDGIPLHYGSIIVTNTVAIDLSFISGNTNFFNSINGKINNIDLSEFDVLLGEDTILDSWTSTNGVVFPIVDRGGLEARKDQFLKLRVRRGRVDLNDFQPFIYVKDVVKKTLTLSGLKIEGDLINDKTYNDLITTNNNRGFYEKTFKENSVFIGKTNTQTITDASFTKITFDDVSSVQFFNSVNSPFDLSNERWTLSFDSIIKITGGFNLSDTTKLVNFQFRRNGTNIQDHYIKGVYVEIDTQSTAGDEHATPGDYFEIWAQVDPSTPGTVDITAGTFTGEILSTATIFANALLPDQESKEFIRDIFKLFNVVCSFDQLTKTINTRFFKNIKNQEEQDLSEYFSFEVSEEGFDIVSSYFRSSLLEYAQDDTLEIEKYNNENTIPYGNGEIEIDNSYLEESGSLYSVNFTAPFSKNYPVFGLQLLKLNFSEYIIPSGNDVDFTSVTDDGGEANFSPTASGSVTLTNNPYISDADGTSALLQMEENDSSSQILAMNMVDIELPIDIRFTYDDATSLPTGDEGFPYRIYNSTVPAYNGDWENTDFVSTPRSSASVAYFAKYLDGTPLDTAKQGLSFGPIEGKDTQTLIETYYSEFRSMLNDPVKPTLSMTIPAHVYNNLDLLRPIRIKTDKFNSLFFGQKVIGYKNGFNSCLLELVKL